MIPEFIKSGLKKVDWLYAVNVKWKSYQVKRAYAITVRHYADRTVKGSCAALLEKRSGDRLKKFRALERPPRIFFLGTDELQDKSGFIQSLERFGHLQHFTRADGRYGQSASSSAKERLAANSERLRELVDGLAQSGEAPDLLFAQTWASYVDPGVLQHIRETYGTLIVNMSLDDRHQYWGERVDGRYGGTYSLIPYIDIELTAAPEAVDWYLKEGCPAVFFPEASYPELFHPMPELPIVHDVGFVGRRYGIRESIVSALRKAGIRVAARGDGWEDGNVRIEDTPAFFAQSRVVLGIGTIGHCEDFYALKLRDFDVPMSGACYVTHDNPDLRLLFDVGKEIVTYRNVDDCVEKVRYCLADEDHRRAIAVAGHRRAMQEHTWDKRFRMLFEVLRGHGGAMTS